jgi:hypothetical protein
MPWHAHRMGLHFPGSHQRVTHFPAPPFFQKKLKEKTATVIGREKK